METNSTAELTGTNSLRSYQGGYFRVLVSPEQTAGTIALVDMTLPRGAEPPMHFHSREDEVFYVLEGTLSFVIGGSASIVTAGNAIFAPRNVPHRFGIESDTARFLNLLTPGDFYYYFMESSVAVVGQPTITPPQGPPPPAVIERLTSLLNDKYGVYLS